MNRLAAAFCAACGLFAACVLAGCAAMPAPAEARRVPAGFFGIAPYDGRELGPRDEAALDALSVTWFRRTFYWSGIEPERGKWDFAAYDRFVDFAADGGRNVLGILAYDVSWLPRSKPDTVSSEDLPLFLEYVRETVTHFRGRVAAWEIWNEPNFRRFWKGSGRDFAALVKAAARVVREADPGALVAASGFSRVPAGLITTMFRAGAFDEVDVISAHPYDIWPAGAVRLLAKLRGLALRYGFSGPLWMTEMGYPTAGIYPHRVSLANLPAAVLKTLAGLAAAGADKVFWYELFDEFTPAEAAADRAPDSEDYFGLVYPDYTWKAGAHAYALAAWYLAGSVYTPEYLHGVPAGVTSLCFLRDDGQAALVLWREGPGSLAARLTLPGEGHLSHDIATGQAVYLPGAADGAPVRIGKTPLFITWRPLAGPGQDVYARIQL